MTKERDSNLELMRIVMMLAIISHHFVVNSGVVQLYDYSNPTGKMIFLQLFGFAGKTAINGFLLISGYFMIKSKFSLDKLFRLYLEVKFYRLSIYILFIIFKIEKFSITGFIKMLFNVIYGVNVGFVATFILLYILSPYINKLVKNITRNQFTLLLGILLFFYTIISTFSYANNTFCEIGWYITVYLLGGYINLYPLKLFENRKIVTWLFNLSLIFSLCSILAINFVNKVLGMLIDPYYFVSNAHKLMAVALSVSMFLFFKGLQIKRSKTINTVASSIFGVLLIHANSDAMRSWLWGNVINVPGHYNDPYLPLIAVISVIIIFLICTAIDLIRKKLIEIPLMKYITTRNKYILIRKYIETICNS